MVLSKSNTAGSPLPLPLRISFSSATRVSGFHPGAVSLQLAFFGRWGFVVFKYGFGNTPPAQRDPTASLEYQKNPPLRIACLGGQQNETCRMGPRSFKVFVARSHQWMSRPKQAKTASRLRPASAKSPRRNARPADPGYWEPLLLRSTFTAEARPGSEEELF